MKYHWLPVVLFVSIVMGSCEEEYDDIGEQESVTSCTDGIQNGNEEAIDCGGSDCLDCFDTTLCGDSIQNGYEDGIDCYNGSDGLSACPPCDLHCSDGEMNEDEEAIDCGGVQCPPCDSSGLCGDGIQNGYETGVDCYDGMDGLSACPPCQELCGDGILNGNEDALDCGGPDCLDCDDISFCGDGILNGYETAIDCYDGLDFLSACPPCITLCSDNVVNGAETDTDCGGIHCPPCSDNDEPDGVLPFLIYEVDGALYESWWLSISAARTPAVDDMDVDALSLEGGAAHNIQFTLQDDDSIPMLFDEGQFTLSLSSGVDEMDFTLIDRDAMEYRASDNPLGISINISLINYSAPEIFVQGGILEGTFSGQLTNVESEDIKTISNGSFRAYFGN